MSTGQPVTQVAGDYEVLCYAWGSNATITAASGMTIDRQQVNGTTAGAAIGHNNTNPLGASVTCTAFAPTLSATNRVKTGVGVLLEYVPTPEPTNPLASITDNFEDGVIDTGLWTTWGTGSQSEGGGYLIQTPSGVSGQYVGVFSVNTFDLTNTTAQIQVAATPSPVAGVQAYFRLEVDANNGIIMGFSDGNMMCQHQIGGTTTTVYTTSWPINTFGLRIVLDNVGGKVWFDSYVAGGPWTNRFSEALPIATTALRVIIGSGCYSTVGTPGSAMWEGVNLPLVRRISGTSAGSSTATGPTLGRKRSIVPITSSAGKARTSPDTYSKQILADGPYSYWRLGDVSGTVAADATGNNRTGIIVNTVNYLRPGGPADSTAIDLTPGTAWMRGPYASFFNGQAWTVEMWINGTIPASGDVGMFIIGESTGTGNIILCILRNRLPILSFWGDDYNAPGTAISSGVWHQVVFLWEGPTTKYQRVYVDGVEYGTGRVSSSVPNIPTGAYSQNGTWLARWGSGTELNGLLDDISIYNYALTPAQIAAHWNAAPNVPTAILARRSLTGTSAGRATVAGQAIALDSYSAAIYNNPNSVAYWRLGDISGTVARDIKGGHDGTYVGSPTLNVPGAIPSSSNVAVNLDGVDDYVDIPDFSPYTPTYFGTIKKDTPQAYYRLNEPSGTAANDSSGNTKTGTYTGTTTRSQIGALVGDGDTATRFTAGYVQCPLLTAFNGTGPGFTVEFWVKSIGAWAGGGTQSFCAGDNGNPDGMIHIYIQPGGTPKLGFWFDDYDPGGTAMSTDT